MGETAEPRRWAAVTGATSGIGAAFARALSAEGLGVVLVARDGEAATAMAADLPGPSEVLVADLSDPRELGRVEARLATPGERRVVMLVNNAATGRWGSFVEQEPDDLAETIAVNVTAAVRMARSVLPGMVAAGAGGVITVSSPAGARPSPSLAAYGASKAFLDALDASLRSELAAAGSAVVVTTVWPGWTRTPFHGRLGQDVAAVPVGSWTTAEFVAREVLMRHRRGETTVRVPEPALSRWALDEIRRVRRGLPIKLKEPVRAVTRLVRGPAREA